MYGSIIMIIGSIIQGFSQNGMIIFQVFAQSSQN